MFKVSQVDFPNKCVLQSLNVAFIIANDFQYTKDLFPIIRQVQSSNAPGYETARARALVLFL